jgi:hypothetical protein
MYWPPHRAVAAHVFAAGELGRPLRSDLVPELDKGRRTTMIANGAEDDSILPQHVLTFGLANLQGSCSRPVSRDTNIVELAAAVDCAWVLRDWLVVGDAKRRLSKHRRQLKSHLGLAPYKT